MEPAKTYLRRIRQEQREILLLMEQRERLRFSLYGRAIRYDQDKIQSSPVDTLGERLAEICDMDDLIVEHVKEMDARSVEAFRIIMDIDEPNSRMLLELYYLSLNKDGRLYSWDDIADELDCSRKYLLNNLHPRALELFEAHRAECG